MDITNLLKSIDLTDNKSVLLVDVSYYTYTRFFATRIWYINSRDKDEVVDMEQDWTLNTEFMTTFKRLFFKNINIILKNTNTSINNVIWAVDSSFSNNWRLALNSEYKLTRKEAHSRNKFNAWDIFRIAKEELIPSMYSSNKIISVNGLEADDIVALLVSELKRNDPTSKGNRSIKYYILANDKDYIQICNDRTILLDANGRNISDKVLTDCSNLEFLLQKILLGDKSDNIEACFMTAELIKLAGIKSKKEELKCTPAKVRDVLKNQVSNKLIMELITLLRGNDEQIKKGLQLENIYFKEHQFSKNAKLIDFAQIPSCYICKCKF